MREADDTKKKDIKTKIHTQEVSLAEMMDARERRYFLQQRLLKEYPGTLVCLTLNIPGPVKLLPGVPEAFADGLSQIQKILSVHGIVPLHTEEIREKTGYEAFISLSADPQAVKSDLIPIEDGSRRGRLFDIDVLRPDGSKVSREDLGMPGRKCLLCSEPAQVCSRSRRHSVAELTAEIQNILSSPESIRSITGFFARLCHDALMAEVSATPKPGLVDRHDNGAHRDMSYETFAASSAAIAPYLAQMARTGYDYVSNADAPYGLFEIIRPIGIEAEKAMFAATGGVNTHKGMIFSMGIVAAVSGWYLRKGIKYCAEYVLCLCGEICRDSLEADFANIDRSNPKTHGERLFVNYGARGIRGEVQNGFLSIKKYALPVLRSQAAAGYDTNTAYLNTLISLMAHVDDTNVLIRTSQEMLAYEKSAAAAVIAAGGAGTAEGMAMLADLNIDFIEKNISPGGCADLLAVTILLHRLETQF